MKRVIKASVGRKFYFGDEAAAKYGELIQSKLAGKTVSKRRDTAEEPGGLIYEANKLGIDMWDLLEALEGMCYEGRAQEIDDSTYRVLSPVKSSSASGWYVGEPTSGLEYGKFMDKVNRDKIEKSWKSWTDVYKLFNDIVEKYFPDEDRIQGEVEVLYERYKHNPLMRSAYKRWNESLDD